MSDEIRYNPNAGRYIDAAGKFVARAKIENLLDQEQAATEVRLKTLTRMLAHRKLSLQQWESQFASTLREAHLKMMLLAVGGQESLTAQIYGAVGYQLRRQYGYLDNFAQQLAAGSITEPRAIQRAASYARSLRSTFSRVEQLARETEGFTEAKRSLDPQARHCASCLRYSTRGAWVPISIVVAPATNCECGQNCRCTIAYRRRRRPRSLSQAGILG